MPESRSSACRIYCLRRNYRRTFEHILGWKRAIKRDPGEFLLELAAAHAPELRFEKVPQQSFEPIVSLVSLLVWAASIGAFGGLWKVIELFVKRHANCRVRLSYVSVDGANIEVTHETLTRKEAETILAKHPPRTEEPARLVVML